ncbi:damage-inducible protein [Leptospira langatensis]|uniref:DNA 3'-5' helicase n=1 Tax=Leptospira langatensis TaxID=2484983 RepID=A0A5F1ZY04_9LEPT|nr:DEAD/DEAH box helicase [Leptospira langatensis]TGK01601.1 damage-inducible protein [Leptospira langatensis]TGL42455.1 damage-inducible protein [Leptospira langatensis]
MKELKFSPEQREVIEDTSRFLQVIAAAGSGKTSTLVGVIQKELERNTSGEEILVLTFTRKAAGEIRERIHTQTGIESVRVHTFHSFCLRALTNWHPRFKKDRPSILLPAEKNAFFREWFRKESDSIGGIPFELLSGDILLPKDFPHSWKIPLLEDYKKFKSKEHKLDLDDLVCLFLDSLEGEEPWTEIPKSGLKRILVDEFQDTDSQQLRFLRLLSDRSRITVVGDDSQSIYAFRGSEPSIFLNFPDLFVPCSRKFLSTNYRSLPKIVEVSSIPIEKNENRIPKTVLAHREGRSRIGRLKMDKISDLFSYLGEFYKASGGDLRILCRSNHRIREYLSVGVPSELLLTIHASKGLEFHTVIVDLSDGWNIRKDSPSSVWEEERRVLYVALSRAKDNLLILGKKSHSNRETAEDIFFSYFKREIPQLK